jgi:formylglycine-generating enzyme required for sulfatase activity
MRRGDGYTYRLPTEAEWEYAARGAQKASPAELGNAYSFGNSTTGLDDHAWSYSNSKDGVKPVATRKANQLGLSDVHGNAWEWVQDAYRKDYEALSSTDPRNESGSYRVIRGGSWYGYPHYLRSAYRHNFGPDASDGLVGFRLVRTPNP